MKLDQNALEATVPADVAELVESLRGFPAGDVLDEFDAAAIENAAATISALSAKVEELTRDNGRLRKVVSQVCVALGNGAHTDVDCTIEFMEFVPTEVGLVVGGLRASLAERDRIIAEKDKALEPFAKFAGDLSALKQRFFLQLLVCPEGDSCPEDYGPHFHAARAARDRRAL